MSANIEWAFCFNSTAEDRLDLSPLKRMVQTCKGIYGTKKLDPSPHFLHQLQVVEQSAEGNGDSALTET